MSRVPVAVVAGCVGLLVYVVIVTTLADWVAGADWWLQALYFLAAGSLWVLPVRWLMLWAARLR